MRRSSKRAVLIFTDSILLAAALWLSFSLRLDNWYWPPGGINDPIVILVLCAPILAVPIFMQFGLYRAIIRYLGMRAVWSVFKAVMIYAAVWGVLVFLSGAQGVPRSVVPINSMVALLAVGGSRMLARWLLRKIDDMTHLSKHSSSGGMRTANSLAGQTRVVIFGAGAAGRQLAVGLGQSRECVLLAFIDDNDQIQGRDLMEVPILSRQRFNGFVQQHQVDQILLAIPSISRKQRSIIIESLRPLNKHIRTIPGLADMARGQADDGHINELDINDLLAREPAGAEEALLQSQVQNHVVMVTGAGGSIGRELCLQILQRKPKVLLLFDSSELALYSLNNELQNILSLLVFEQAKMTTVELLPNIIPLLGSVTDENRVNDIVGTWQPSIIYHAAAVKHVPIVEHNIAESVKTNIFGTLTMAKVAIERHVDRFVLVSTDKAVNPTNAMGASKRCCELILQALSAETHPDFESFLEGGSNPQVKLKTQLTMVRFGNVLGSSGSVVPYFRSQIEKGGPITLTHKDIIRYFMTIPEAAQLVMQTGAMAGSRKSNSINGKGGEVYVLDMGEPVKIYDLARRMVELSGLRVKDDNLPSGDIAIQIVGLRPGEKLYEELLIGNNPQTTQHPRIMKASEKFLPWSELQPMITMLRIAAVNGDVMMIRSMLQLLVPEYKPDEKVVDWVYREQITQAGKSDR